MSLDSQSASERQKDKTVASLGDGNNRYNDDSSMNEA